MMLENLINYLKQPSTYQGLATIAAAVGWATFPQYWQLLSVAYPIVLGAIMVVKNDNKPDPREQAKLKLMQAKAKAIQLGIKDE